MLFLQYSTCESGERTHNEIGTSSARSALRQIASQRASRSGRSMHAVQGMTA